MKLEQIKQTLKQQGFTFHSMDKWVSIDEGHLHRATKNGNVLVIAYPTLPQPAVTVYRLETIINIPEKE